MNCAEVQKLLSAYIDRQLPAWEHAPAAQHLETCADCQADLQALIQIKRSLRGIALPALPDDLRHAILEETLGSSAVSPGTAVIQQRQEWKSVLNKGSSSASPGLPPYPDTPPFHSPYLVRWWVPAFALTAAFAGWLALHATEHALQQRTPQIVVTEYQPPHRAVSRKHDLALHHLPDAVDSKQTQ